MTLLDGYRLLARDDRCRLGWRILLHLDPCSGTDAILRSIHQEGTELVEALPDEYKGRHLAYVLLVAALLHEQELDDPAITELTTVLDMDADKIKTVLGINADQGEDEDEDGETDEPSIACTTLVGAKGLSAEHVFIVGLVDGEFPKDPAAVIDDEVCKLIVGLSRTRKACHLVSCGMWGGPPFRKPSSFLRWLRAVAIEERKVDKQYWET